jgi:hypothetical protein
LVLQNFYKKAIPETGEVTRGWGVSSDGLFGCLPGPIWYIPVKSSWMGCSGFTRRQERFEGDLRRAEGMETAVMR